MTAKELAERLGISTERLFQRAYERYGRLYSIGGPTETHKRYLQAGIIPIYVARFIRETENALPKIDDQLPLFI